MADIIDLIYSDHDWFRRQFFLLDAATTADELGAIWEPLATRLDAHAQAEEEIFYPALLKLGDDPEDETDDAIGDHNDIRDAVRESRQHEAGSPAWSEAVDKARRANGEHLEEEEREGMTNVIKNTSADFRTELGMQWMQFWSTHQAGENVDDSDKDPQTYIKENS